MSLVKMKVYKSVKGIVMFSWGLDHKHKIRPLRKRLLRLIELQLEYTGKLVTKIRGLS